MKTLMTQDYGIHVYELICKDEFSVVVVPSSHMTLLHTQND